MKEKGFQNTGTQCKAINHSFLSTGEFKVALKNLSVGFTVIYGRCLRKTARFSFQLNLSTNTKTLQRKKYIFEM